MTINKTRMEDDKGNIYYPHTSADVVFTTDGQSVEEKLQNVDVEVTKEDVGLGNVDNTSDMDKPVSTAQQAAIDGIDVVEKLGYTPADVVSLSEVEQQVTQIETNVNTKTDDSKIATTTELGHIRPDGTTITVDPETGIASGASNYMLPIASAEVLGGVKVDGNTIKIDGTGTISSSATVSVGDWIPATLVNGWTGILSNPKYFKDASGYVNFTGAVKGTSGNVFTFPVGYRPSSQQSVVCFAVSGNAISGYVFKGLSEARIDSLGQLEFGLTYDASTTYVLNGKFKAI